MSPEEELRAEDAAAAEAQAVLEKFDRESNVRIWEGVPRSIVRYLMVAFAVYSVLINLVFNWETRIERASFVGGLVFLIFLIFPATKKGKKKPNHIPWYDLLLGVVGGGTYFYFVFNCQAIIKQGIKLESYQVILGAIGVLITLEACRRATGIPIVVVASCFIIYAMTQKSLALNVYNLFYTTEGVIGTPIRACSTFIVLFVIFGAFLEKTGISNFFIQLANSIAGGSSGGPAKVAVISSALCGMVSGSSVGNTVTTGAVTIPLMKSNGYKGEFAGAVEAAASTGGQIMPPIMGAAAFLMVEYANVAYGSIAVRAILPAALYFAGIFITVHLEAKKLGLKGLPRDQLPQFGRLIVAQGYLLLPLLLLVYLIITRTMAMAAVLATVLAIVVSMFRKETRLNLSRFLDALENGAKSTLTVGIACAVAGIIACVITTTGIGTKLITLIVNASGGYLIVALLLTMVTCIILGMGVPTTANYVIMATTCAPILIKMGVPTLAAHMFVFYFGIVADITPPVALAAYAGSAIAKSKPMKTALNASKLAIAAFIVPYVFALNPAMLFIETHWYEVVLIILTSLLGIFGVALGTEGFIYKKVPWLLRIVAIVGGLTLLYPGIVTDVVGLVLVGGIILYQRMSAKREGQLAR
ncbi:TRAP transporter permease [Oscillibacter sp. MSJ-2]|uniref:TRAP transporter permease n=1 Tax=Dysosmobacter acutus TaxID=2841504 RepID=A0ABS6FCL5_9FIRM|nr:TRAP transporter permease [Dysosmobacter acutus]MBU5628019.1 TRAP transporter permease [Dysosmobacter acutus]